MNTTEAMNGYIIAERETFNYGQSKRRKILWYLMIPQRVMLFSVGNFQNFESLLKISMFNVSVKHWVIIIIIIMMGF